MPKTGILTVETSMPAYGAGMDVSAGLYVDATISCNCVSSYPASIIGS